MAKNTDTDTTNSKKKSSNPADFIQEVNQAILERLDVNDIKNRFNSVKRYRATNWERKWQVIQESLNPNASDFGSYSMSNNRSTGSTKGYRSYTSSASSRVHHVASLLNAHTSDPSVKWLDLVFYDPCYLMGGFPLFLGRIEPAVRWLDRCKNALYGLFANPESNFYPSNYNICFDWYSLGTACREVIRRKDNGQILFNVVSMQEIFAETGPYGDINVIYRLLKKTPIQAVALWGDKVSPKVMSSLHKGGANDTFNTDEYLEVTQANPLYGAVPVMLPELITYVVDLATNRIIDLDMHNYSPYIISRFDISPNEVYGRSYVWQAMPEVRLINKLNYLAVKSAAFAVEPVILGQDIGTLNYSQYVPGGIMQGLDVHGNATVKPMFTTQNFPSLMDFIKYKVGEMDESLVSRDMFPAENTNMTATEANIRKLQAMNKLRPMLVRFEREDLSRTVTRSLSLLMESSRVDPFPYGEVEEFMRQTWGMDVPEGFLMQQLPYPLKQIDIKFSGVMARMQRMQDLQNMDMWLQRAGQLAQVSPEALDWIDCDGSMNISADILGIPLDSKRTAAGVMQVRKSRSDAQQAEAMEKREMMEIQKENMIMDTMVKTRKAGIDESD